MIDAYLAESGSSPAMTISNPVMSRDINPRVRPLKRAEKLNKMRRINTCTTTGIDAMEFVSSTSPGQRVSSAKAVWQYSRSQRAALVELPPRTLSSKFLLVNPGVLRNSATGGPAVSAVIGTLASECPLRSRSGASWMVVIPPLR